MLIKKFTKLFSLKSARHVYKIDYQKSESYKKLAEASAQAPNLETWQEGGDKAQTEINNRCDTARSEYVEKMTTEEKTRTGEVITEYEKRESAEAEKIKQELTEKHGTADKSKWKAEYDKLWMARVKPIQNEKYAKRDQVHEEIWNEINAVSARMYSLRDTAITQMRAAFAAREKAKEKIGEKVKEVMNRELDDQTRDENEERAEFAQNLADDGFTNWNTPADYLDSKIDGVELNDKEIENIAMGIAYSLHDKEAGDNDPAKKFMKGLSDKEDAMGGLLDDNGVRISDIQLQLLETLGQKTKTKDQREDARESEAGKLIAAIASDKNIPAHLRGMLLGKLAKGGEKSIKTVQSMYAMLKKVDKEKLDITGHSKGTIALDAAALAAATSIYGGLPAVLMLGAAQGFRDENSLERCGGALVALEDMQHVVKFQEVVAAYNATGVKNDAVEKILATAKSPGQMRRKLDELKKAVGEAPAGGDRKGPVEKIKKAPGYAKSKELYAKFQVPFKYDAKLDALANDKKMSAPEFAASLAEVGTRVKNSAEDAELVAAAAKVRSAINKDIALVNAYQDKWNIIGQKRADRLKIPSVKQFAQISAVTPKEVLAEFDKIKTDLAAAKKTAGENSAKCDKYAKIYGKYKKRGGGAGGGRRAAPRPKSAPGPLSNAASKGAEKGKKREWVNVYSEKKAEREKNMKRYDFKKKVQKPTQFNEEGLPKEPGAYRAKKGDDTYVVVVNAGGKKDYYKKK